MNLTKPTHNLMSNIGINATQDKKPEVGMGVTVCLDVDRIAATVTQYDPDNQILIVQQDKATRTDDDETNQHQTYDYEADPKGKMYVFRRFKLRWEEIQLSKRSGRWVRIPGNNVGLILGERQQFKNYEEEAMPAPSAEVPAENQNEVTKAVKKVANKK